MKKILLAAAFVLTATMAYAGEVTAPVNVPGLNELGMLISGASMGVTGIYFLLKK